MSARSGDEVGADLERDEATVADRESSQEVQGDGGYAEAIRDTGEDGQADGDRAELHERERRVLRRGRQDGSHGASSRAELREAFRCADGDGDVVWRRARSPDQELGSSAGHGSRRRSTYQSGFGTARLRSSSRRPPIVR